MRYTPELLRNMRILFPTRFQLVLALMLWADCSIAQRANPMVDDSRFMANVLTRLAKRADPLANIYLNKQRAEGMSSIMDQPMSMGKRINMGVRIAQELSLIHI